MNKDIALADLKNLLIEGRTFIDVRAPVEFAQGHLPGAVNLSLLDDKERAAVGTTYKQRGREAAVKLGHELISGPVKEERIQRWRDYLSQHPEAVFYCYRGGMRSQISRDWIRERGVERPLVLGGYKAARHLLLSQLEVLPDQHRYLAVTGSTGSGKTAFLREAQGVLAHIDLESLAHHRGSAFGGFASAQPSQGQFENFLALDLMKKEALVSPGKAILVEDESRMIGKCTIPEKFFLKLRESPVLWIDEDLPTRVERIFQDYIVEPLQKPEAGPELYARYRRSLEAIAKKLGGLRTTEIHHLLTSAEAEFYGTGNLQSNRDWIESLLKHYYDPLYLASLKRRQVNCLFRGSRRECLDFLRTEMK